MAAKVILTTEKREPQRNLKRMQIQACPRVTPLGASIWARGAPHLFWACFGTCFGSMLEKYLGCNVAIDVPPARKQLNYSGTLDHPNAPENLALNSARFSKDFESPKCLAGNQMAAKVILTTKKKSTPAQPEANADSETDIQIFAKK